MKKTILGVKIDDVSMSEAVETVESWLSKDGKHYVFPKEKGKVLRLRSKISHTEARAGFYIVTPNPEFLVTAQKDPNFRKILNNADLAIPDGVGLKLAGVRNTVAGTDLMEKLVKLAAKKGYTIGLLGGKAGVAELCAKRLVDRYIGLKVSFIQSEPVNMRNGCDILFIAFGHPKQEYWINENLDKIPVKVAMGVGGAFDYISGTVLRAPKWIRVIGLEWFFRLIVQPWRIKRQISLLKYIWLLTRRLN